jgi:hypothetical protein
MKVALGALVVLVPLAAWPCSGFRPDVWSSPANGATDVPRNLAAFLIGACALPQVDGGLQLTRGSSDAGVAFTERFTTEGQGILTSAWTEVRPTEAFAEGETVRVDHARGCSEMPSSISWTFGPEAPLPERLGDLRVSSPRRGSVDVPGGSSCVLFIDAVWATIDLAPDALDARWVPYVEKTLRIDGAVWARQLPGRPEQAAYGPLAQSVTRVHASCDPRQPGGLAEGDHVAELAISFPGTNRTLVTTEPFSLRCNAPRGDAPLLRPGLGATPPPVGCGCSSSAATSLLLLVAVIGPGRRAPSARRERCARRRESRVPDADEP